MMTDECQPREPRGPVGPGSADTGAKIDPWLLGMLACPVDHAAVRVEGVDLVCNECGRHYPIRDGIPMMMPTDAEKRT